jgi:hypothetical protein
MLPAANCDVDRPGFNSLPLVRHCVQYGRTIEDAVAVIENAPRGVTWLYPIADGKKTSGKVACVVESGRAVEETDPLSYADEGARPHLPDSAFLTANPSGAEVRRGMMVRWNGWKNPAAYIDFNTDLWVNMGGGVMHPDAFTPDGYISRREEGEIEQNCPGPWYFAPQREECDDVVLTTNHAVIPEMRLFGMGKWTHTVAKSRYDDIQWRYDELSRQINEALRQGPVGYAKARDLVDYLARCGYYEGETTIEGAVCLFDLSQGTVEAHYGRFDQAWVRLTLPRYIEAAAP